MGDDSDSIEYRDDRSRADSGSTRATPVLWQREHHTLNTDATAPISPIEVRLGVLRFHNGLAHAEGLPTKFRGAMTSPCLETTSVQGLQRMPRAPSRAMVGTQVVALRGPRDLDGEGSSPRLLTLRQTGSAPQGRHAGAEGLKARFSGQ
jgi:hypothetical protein